MAEHKNFKIRRFPRPAGEWTPITVPAGEYSRCVVENTDLTTDGAFRTIADDGMTEKTIPMGQELDIFARQACFQGGDILGYFWNSTAVSAVVSFVR